MNIKNKLQIFVVGIALFAMFFGGGNLTFPLWVGIETTSPFASTLGFLLSGVLLAFYGIFIGLYFKGDYEKCFSVWGKKVGQILAFTLLLFWIPLGSGPRCNQLAFGAFCQMGGNIPLWVYSGLYSILVFALVIKKNRFIEILGKVLTPVLVFALFFLILSIFKTPHAAASATSFDFSNFFSAFSRGYYTQDLIAAIFFSSTIISLVKAKKKENYKSSFVRNACLIAISLLSIIYIGMVSVGHVNAESLSLVSKDQLLYAAGSAIFDPRFQIVIFLIITLSVLSTSMALALVYAEYMEKTLFKNKLSYRTCLFISLSVSYLMSTIGFDKLAVLISYAMSFLYPFLLVTITAALFKDLYLKYPVFSKREKVEEGATKEIA